jgi:hypothetical protein
MVEMGRYGTFAATILVTNIAVSAQRLLRIDSVQFLQAYARGSTVYDGCGSYRRKPDNIYSHESLGGLGNAWDVSGNILYI